MDNDSELELVWASSQESGRTQSGRHNNSNMNNINSGSLRLNVNLPPASPSGFMSSSQSPPCIPRHLYLNSNHFGNSGNLSPTASLSMPAPVARPPNPVAHALERKVSWRSLGARTPRSQAPSPAFASTTPPAVPCSRKRLHSSLNGSSSTVLQSSTNSAAQTSGYSSSGYDSGPRHFTCVSPAPLPPTKRTVYHRRSGSVSSCASSNAGELNIIDVRASRRSPFTLPSSSPHPHPLHSPSPVLSPSARSVDTALEIARDVNYHHSMGLTAPSPLSTREHSVPCGWGQCASRNSNHSHSNNSVSNSNSNARMHSYNHGWRPSNSSPISSIGERPSPLEIGCVSSHEQHQQEIAQFRSRLSLMRGSSTGHVDPNRAQLATERNASDQQHQQWIQGGSPTTQYVAATATTIRDADRGPFA